MNTPNLQTLLKKYLKSRQTKNHAGFTILEVLMAITVGSIVTYGMLALVVNLLKTDQRETAKSQTQAEMDQALDYIATEMKQAVYIYEGECLGTNEVKNDDGSTKCVGLGDSIDFEIAGVTPVLAFWKLEDVPYQKNPTPEQELPGKCDSNDDDYTECLSIKTNRHTYTLVVYGLIEDQDPDDIWAGPARITRFQLRKYDELSTLTKTEGYQTVDGEDPKKVGWEFWESSELFELDNSNNPVLVDLVDQPESENFPDPDCSKFNLNEGEENEVKYSNGGSDDLINSFYTCVREPLGSGYMQDVIIYLRGNAAERAGQKGSRDPVYLPDLQTRVKARSVFDREPPGFE